MKTKTILIAALLLASAASAQIPDELTNLKVLPKDISRGELIQVMRGMADGLGLRCNHCHVGGSETSLEGMDFASDEKELKRTARVMLQMVKDINETLLPKIGKGRGELVEVRCRTCHHGLQRPQDLRDLLTAVLDEEGRGAAVAKYRELRESYYGRDAFDFGSWQLLGLAERLAKADRVDDAYAFVELNLEFYPDFGMNHVFLGRYYAERGQSYRALTSYEKAIELSPDMAPRIRKMIDELKK
jgi:tetratricopeptide (TPR) repeat protein